MSPKHKMITTVWCASTMVVTLILSHGHLIVRELMRNWPRAMTWEGRFESAIYTQGGLIFCASLIITVALLSRSFFMREQEKELARRELAQRERHERFTAARHEAMLDALAGMFSSAESTEQTSTVEAGRVSNQKPIAKKGLSLWSRAGLKFSPRPKKVFLRRSWYAFRIARLLMAILAPEATIFELVSSLLMEVSCNVCCALGIPP